MVVWKISLDFLFILSLSHSISNLGIAYYMAIPGSPLMGKLLDVVGKRPIGVAVGTALTIPTFLLFAFSELTPIVGMIFLGMLVVLAFLLTENLIFFLLGFSYVITVGALWPSIPLLVNQNQVSNRPKITYTASHFFRFHLPTITTTTK